MTKIFLIRHAEAEGNIYRRSHGEFDGRVIGRGYAQIKQLEERFLKETIHAVYSSDLTRTITTAKAISEPHGLRIKTTQSLREVNVGEWEDIAWGDLLHNYPEMAELFGSDPARWKVKGSEDYLHVRERMKNCISEIGERHEGNTVAVFSHGFAMRAFLCEIMGLPSHKTNLLPYCDNTAVTLLTYGNGKFTIEYEGDNSHLDSNTSTFASQTWWRDGEERKHEDLRYVRFDVERDSGIYRLCGVDCNCGNDGEVKLTAYIEDEPAGILCLDPSRDSGESVGWISHLRMKPELCRPDLEVQLVGQAVSEYRKLGRGKVKIETGDIELLARLCDRYEFAEAGSCGNESIAEKCI